MKQNKNRYKKLKSTGATDELTRYMQRFHNYKICIPICLNFQIVLYWKKQIKQVYKKRCFIIFGILKNMFWKILYIIKL